MTNKHTKVFIRTGRHFGCAKRQIENSLRIFATFRRKISQMNGKFAIVCEYSRTFRLTERRSLRSPATATLRSTEQYTAEQTRGVQKARPDCVDAQADYDYLNKVILPCSLAHARAHTRAHMRKTRRVRERHRRKLSELKRKAIGLININIPILNLYMHENNNNNRNKQQLPCYFTLYNILAFMSLECSVSSS